MCTLVRAESADRTSTQDVRTTASSIGGRGVRSLVSALSSQSVETIEIPNTSRDHKDTFWLSCSQLTSQKASRSTNTPKQAGKANSVEESRMKFYSGYERTAPLPNTAAPAFV
jgi:hypothetical protein